MVFQNITAVELYHLQEEYLQLHKGKIEVPGKLWSINCIFIEVKREPLWTYWQENITL